MLDKSMPYKNIIMRIDRETVNKIADPVLPEGYRFRFFRDGDEYNWARIAASVGEFPDEEAARDSFVRDHFDWKEELYRRCLFVEDPDGLAVATASAWFTERPEGDLPYVNWVSALPGYQGLGLGKAIVTKVLVTFRELGYEGEIHLHTQTWSAKAFVLYHNLGFRTLKSGSFTSVRDHGRSATPYPNDYEEAMEILKDHIAPEKYAEIVAAAI